MATRITFLSGRHTLVTENEPEVVGAVCRDNPNPATLEGTDGVVQFAPARRSAVRGAAARPTCWPRR